MKLRNIVFVLIILVVIFQLLPLNSSEKTEIESKKPLVALSTFSLYEITRSIADESVETFMILPFGVDAHSYEPTPKQVAKLYKSDLVVYSGAGLEPWIKGFEFKNRSVDMSLHVDLRELGEDDGHDHAHHDEHDGHDEHGHEGESEVDPHYWLDTDNMIKAAKLITAELIRVSPQNRELYIKNRDSYVEMLKKLDEDYKKTLSTCKRNTIVVNHNAFSYLSHRYGFEVEALSGLSPEAEPSAKSMAELIEHVKEHKLSTVFFESFVSDKAMKSIAKEAKVGVDVLQPLGNITADEAKAKLTYEDIMRANLKKISKALECVNEV